MASHVLDTANMRTTGATENVFYAGTMGRIVVFEYTTAVANGAITNIGMGCKWVAWENHTNDAGANLCSPTFDGVDRVSFEVAGSPVGRLWCFYKAGCGDARGSTGGTTQAPNSIAEIGRDAQRMRLVVFSVSGIGNGQSSTLKLTGIRHLLTRASASANIVNARWAAAADQSVGTVGWRSSASNKACRLFCLCAPGTGLDA